MPGSSVGQVWNYVSINANSTVSSERIWSKYRLSSDLSFYFYALFLFIKEVSLVYFSPIDAIGNLSNITQDCQPTYWTDSYLLGHVRWPSCSSLSSWGSLQNRKREALLHFWAFQEALGPDHRRYSDSGDTVLNTWWCLKDLYIIFPSVPVFSESIPLS